MAKPHLAHTLGFVLLAGCAHVKPATAPSSPPPAQTTAPAPSPPAQAIAPAPESPRPSAAPVASDATKPNLTPPADAAQPPTTAKVSTAKRSKPKAPATASTAASAAAVPAPKATLDFKTLVERLRNTSAIGVFTKLSVKNQVDDLLGDFRGFYAGKVPPTLDDLHERYDGLVLKVVTLIQNGDASLAAAISASRSAIWEKLSNRESFQAI